MYSSESITTWLIPINDLSNVNHLSGLRTLQVFLQVKPYDVNHYINVDVRNRARCQFASLEMFKGPSLKEVDVLIITPDWEDAETDELREATISGVAIWQSEIRDILL